MYQRYEWRERRGTPVLLSRGSSYIMRRPMMMFTLMSNLGAVDSLHARSRLCGAVNQMRPRSKELAEEPRIDD
jgi:hypothetical protein